LNDAPYEEFTTGASLIGSDQTVVLITKPAMLQRATSGTAKN